MSDIKTILNQLPKLPWIYKFIDNNWKIIYIWKSVNLKSRVNSYFNWKAKLNFAKQQMIKQISNIEIIITNNETESLILETTLIKKHLPKYNILMKDWKNHIYIKITNEEFPKIIKTRYKTNSEWNKSTYFWPYISNYYVNNLLKTIKHIFWYWIWEHNFFMDKKTYNLDKYIFKNNYQINEYHKIIENIKDFLNWNTHKVKKIIEEKMLQKAKELNFEEAQKLKEKLDSIKILEENQIVRDWVKWDMYIMNIVEKFEKYYVWVIEIKDNKIIWFYNYDIENKLEENKSELLKYIVEQKYIDESIEIIDDNTENKIWENKKYDILNKNWINKKIIFVLPFEIDIINPDIKIEVPQIWVKKELLELCYKNIYEYAYKSHLDSLSTKWFTKKTMQNILNLLWYKQINSNVIFECNDISHISWNHTVASRSIIENWKSNTSKYKKLKIKTLKEWEINDFDSMREVIIRRLKELEKLNNLPDLIIIDWWKWQLSSVVEIIKESEKNIQVIWIAKKEEELFLPWKKEPIILEKDSLELRLIQKIRDEAHRFAITFNRDTRIKSMKKNILEELPWFWPKTRKKILNKYWNIKKLKEVNKQELKEILNKTQIETLENHWIIEYS